MSRLKQYLAMATVLVLPVVAACGEDVMPPPPTGSIVGQVSIEGMGIDGVTVSLSNGASTATAGGGNYRFDTVEQGSYTVTISGFPADASFDATSAPANIGDAGGTETVDFRGSYIRTASIMGTVTVENMGLAGVTVRLSGMADSETATDDSGQYSFTGLRSGTYSVEISGFDTDEVSFSSTSGAATVGVGESKVVSFDGTYLRTAGIQGQVSVDGEGLGGVTVTLMGEGAEEASVTDAGGLYAFSQLKSGAYTVAISGYDTDDYEFETTSKSVTVATGETANVPFEGTLLRTAGIAGRVSVGGMGLDGVTVTLAGAAEATATTANGGQYAFAGLAAGTYVLSIANPDEVAYNFAEDEMQKTVMLADDQSAIVNFEGTHTRTASVSGMLYLDEAPQDKMYTANEPALAHAGIPLLLQGPGINDVTVGVTGADGSFAFDNLMAGDYRVLVNMTEEIAAGIAKAGYAFVGDLTGATVNVAAGMAERVFPAIGREDPLLTDDERDAINARIPDALALQRDRADSDRHAWALMRRAATERFTASWSRRSSATGGPTRASSLILESAASNHEGQAVMQSEASLTEQGRIERISSVAAFSPGGSASTENRGALRILNVPDERSFDLELLSEPMVDIRAVLPAIWPGAEFAERARLRRNASQFTEFDGLLSQAALPEDWRPLDRSWSASDLETFVTCPYRFYLIHILGVGGNVAAEPLDRPRRNAHGRIIRQILSSWVREYEHVQSDRTWFEYAEQPQFMNTTARRILDNAAEAGLLGPAAGVSSIRNETLRDLDRARRREVADARDGWRPLEVNISYDHAPIRVVGARSIRLRGLIHRIDEHAGGRRRAVSFFTGRTIPDVRGFINGSSFQSVAALTALTQRGIPIAQAEVEHRSVTSRGEFESQTLRGESLVGPGGRGAPSDAERLRDALATIADQLEAGHFIPYPGHPPEDRPNCASCPVESACTADIGRRYQHKSRQNPDIVRPLETMRRQRR